MFAHGSPLPVFEFDEDCSYFAVILLVHRLMGEGKSQNAEQVSRLLMLIGDDPISRAELMVRLGLHHRPAFLSDDLQPVVEQSLFEMAPPDEPRSHLQRYRPTA